MGWSTRLFLLSTGDALHRLAGAAFTRMLRADSGCRAPDFAGQRVRLASVTIELAEGAAVGVRHLSFSMLDFNAQGALDVQRLNAQQVARLDSMLSDVLAPANADPKVIDATSKFAARGSS